jgi:hypothetical protein
MIRYEVENIYKANGLKDFRLQNTTDILKCHDIDVQAIKGYSELDELNRRAYKKFIVKFLNSQGLDSRIELVPMGIYYVEDVECFAKDPADPQYKVPVAKIIKSIDKNGLFKIIHSFTLDECGVCQDSCRKNLKIYDDKFAS